MPCLPELKGWLYILMPGVILPFGLPIREANVILLQVWKAKGNLEQHLFGLCWLDKSFSQM